jgi:hypothetical protein
MQSRFLVVWERGDNDAAHKEGAPVDWEPGGHYIGQHNKDGACIMSASVVVKSGHQYIIDEQPLPPKIDIPCYRR